MTMSPWDKMEYRGEQNGERRRQCGVAVSPGLQSTFKIVFPGARDIAKLTKHKLFMQEIRGHSPPRTSRSRRTRDPERPPEKQEHP